jgi:arabinofuranosyltransferase
VSDLVEITQRYAQLIAPRLPAVLLLAAFGPLVVWLVRRAAAAGWVLLVSALAAGLWFAWGQRALVDDAFITFRYTENLVNGFGAVYNPGEWVQGYTNFLWMVWLAAGCVVTGRPATEVALVSGPVVYVGLVLATAGLGRAVHPGRGWAPLGAAWLAVHYSTTAFATTGLESNLAALFVVSGAWAFVARPDRVGAVLAGLVWILAALTRPDHALFYAIGAGVLLWRHRRDPDRWAVWTVYAAPFSLWLAWAAWAQLTYGSWIPNTFYTKVGGDWYWSQGAVYAWVSLLGEQVLWPLLLCVVWLATTRLGQRERWLVAWMVPCVVLFQLYLLRIGGDFMLGRFYLSVVPLIAIGAERAVWSLAGRRIGWGLTAAAVLAASARGVSVVRDFRLEWNLADENTVYRVIGFDPVTIEHSNWRHGQQLRKVFSDRGLQPVIATSGIGMIGYYAGLEVIDVRGLTDATVAHQPLKHRGKPGHEKMASQEYLVSRDVRLMRARTNDPAIAHCLLIRLGGRTQDDWQIYTWDEALMSRVAEVSPEVRFERPEVCLDRYVTDDLDTRDLRQLQRDLDLFDRYFFDRYGPGRWRPFLTGRLAELGQPAPAP